MGERAAAGALAVALFAVAVLAMGTAGPRAAAATVPDPAVWRLNSNGIGPLQLGMSADRASALVPGLSIAHHQFCDTWTVPGLVGVSLLSAHSRAGLSAVSISSYYAELEPGHGVAGVELGDSVHKLKRTLGKRLRFVESIPSLHRSFYRLYSQGGRRTAAEFTIDTRSGRIEYEQAGFLGEFYYTDGVELCG